MSTFFVHGMQVLSFTEIRCIYADRFLFLLLLFLLPRLSPAQDDAELPRYRLIILNFKVEQQTYNHLVRDIPEALEPELAGCPELITLEREQHAALLETIDIDPDRQNMFNPQTVAQLGQQVGANLALVGKIRQRGGQIRIDAKVVEIATGIRRAETFFIGKEGDLYALDDLAREMHKFGQDILDKLNQDCLVMKTFEVRSPRSDTRMWFYLDEKKYEGRMDGTEPCRFRLPEKYFGRIIHLRFTPGCGESAEEEINEQISEEGVDLCDW